MDMELVTRKVGDLFVVGLAQPGTLEASNVEDFRTTVAELVDAVNSILVDLSNVTFLDSSGLGALVAIWRNLSLKGGQVKLCGINPSVRTVFELTRIHRIFEIYDTQAEAISSFDIGIEE